ncbi:MAG: hypothetical protein KGZ58_13940 [Ignavibacteriales bacterium]|nr:hypothetical protein [Ignavibacteriales bacterium]
MKLTKKTIEEFAKVLIRIGEAGFLGSIATLFVSGLSNIISIAGISTSIISISIGLFIFNINDK